MQKKSMTNRENTLAILKREPYERMPVVHFGFWKETVQKWCDEGHLPMELRDKNNYNYNVEKVIADKLGFDFGWGTQYSPDLSLIPPFERKIIEVLDDGFRKVQNVNGVIELEKDDAGSIPAEVDHTLKDRESWDNEFKHRLKFDKSRISIPSSVDDSNPVGIYCGSLFGRIRDYMGIEGISYLYIDDPDLYEEIIDTVANLCYTGVEEMLKTGIKVDFGHFWEDICFKNGPLVSPSVFDEIVGPYYKKMTDLLKRYGVDIVSLDCDGLIDALIPTWLENGVNTMFPIEVGTWNASIKPWREKYGDRINGVGGMDKRVFAYDYDAIDKEIERLKPLMYLGGYIPCPDHRIPPDAIWENVQYYCEKMKKLKV